MKKLVALVLALLMLLSVTVIAQAEEELYLRQLPQYAYYSESILTWESYPEIRVAPYYAYQFFSNSSYSRVDPIFLCFPLPDGASVNNFETDYVHLLDPTNSIQYAYQVKTSDSWEEFLNKAEQDDYIVMDDSGVKAAYINPGSRCAYGMIGTKEFGKSSKLLITINLDYLTSRMPQETIVTDLTEAITAEVNRVYSQMHYETFSPFWNNGEYKGMKILDDYDFEYMLKVDFPSLVCAFSDGSTVESSLIVTQFNYDTLYGVHDFGNGVYIQTQIKMGTYSYAVNKVGEEDPDAAVVTQDDGTEWYLYLSNLSKNGYASTVYAATPLNHTSSGGKTYYLTFQFSGTGLVWNGYDDAISDLALFTFEEVDPSSDPYVPTERPSSNMPEPEPEPEPAPAPAGTWLCTNCDTENSGNFCTNCGAAKPVSNEWTCPGCGSVNTGNFCPNCGTKKPE